MISRRRSQFGRRSSAPRACVATDFNYGRSKWAHQRLMRLRRRVRRWQLDSDAEPSNPGLTADEADLLAPPPFAAHEPWVVPLTVRADHDAVVADMADVQPL
jgi:hypothetical protein